MDWKTRYRESDTPWDKGCPSPVLSELIAKQPQFFHPSSTVLIPGCGKGHDSQPFLSAGLSVTGIDVSALAMDAASSLYGASERLMWTVGDIFKMPSEYHNTYDLIWEHTCYCAIDPSLRPAYVDAMFELLKPNQFFVGVFFIETGVPLAEGPPFKTSRDEVYENFDRKFHLVWEGKPSLSYPGREDREWVMIWRKPICAY